MPAKITQNEFIARALAAHGDRYDYSRAKYANSTTKVTVGCPVHGWIEVNPQHHANGHHCKLCAAEWRADKVRADVDETLDQLRRVAPHLEFPHLHSEYRSRHEAVTCRCLIHGTVWKTYVNSVLKKNTTGCAECKKGSISLKNRITFDAFLNRANLMHRGVYGYSKTHIESTSDMITVTCPKHGDFTVRAHGHIYCRTGCPKCGSRSSWVQREIYAAVLSEFPDAIENYRLPTRREVDIFIPSIRVGIEFNGNRFHASDTKHKNYHAQKVIDCRKDGIALFHVFSHSYNKDPDRLVRLIKLAVEPKGPEIFHTARVIQRDRYDGFEREWGLVSPRPECDIYIAAMDKHQKIVAAMAGNTNVGMVRGLVTRSLNINLTKCFDLFKARASGNDAVVLADLGNPLEVGLMSEHVSAGRARTLDYLLPSKIGLDHGYRPMTTVEESRASTVKLFDAGCIAFAV